MADWLPIAAVADCPPGSSLERIVGDRIVALCNVDGTWHAIDGLCSHQGGPLGSGSLCGTLLRCPWHGWQFDVVTGRHRLSPSVHQERFQVRECDGQVWILTHEANPQVAVGATGTQATPRAEG
ncbi:MAG: Rieske (2Fe-2S) protein [Planctomycetota bacterium]|nr:MAG: Rieske (2Fe-2S) protein [Planctomycetota bacterium]